MDRGRAQPEVDARLPLAEGQVQVCLDPASDGRSEGPEQRVGVHEVGEGGGGEEWRGRGGGEAAILAGGAPLCNGGGAQRDTSVQSDKKFSV